MTAPATPAAPAKEHWTRDRLESWFRAAAFVVLTLLGAIAVFRAYFALENAIIVWLRPQYVALAQAGFSLMILAVVIWLLRAWVISRPRG